MTPEYVTTVARQALLILALVALVRAAPWPAAWKQAKPLGCDACMCWWPAIALGAVDLFSSSAPFAAAGLAWVILTWLRKGELVPPTE